MFFQRRNVFKLVSKINSTMNIKAAGISAEMVGSRRDIVMLAFKRGNAKVLVCSDVCSRGLNLNVDLIINFDLPMIYDRQFNPKIFTYRVSRTGRFGFPGFSVTLNSGCNSNVKGVLLRDFNVKLIDILI